MLTVTVATAGETATVVYGSPVQPSTVFGPTGTHWPTRTPAVTDPVAVVTVACTWAAISAAIKAATEPTIVRVQPGSLPGNGAGATSKPVIQGVGVANQSSRVLVTAANGFGTVKVTGSFRIQNVAGVTFDLLDANGFGALLSGCEDVSLCRFRGIVFNYNGAPGSSNMDIEYVECVVPDTRVTPADGTAFRTASTAGGGYSGIKVIGCYVASMYRPSGSTAHLDGIQLSGQGNNSYGDVEYVDTVVFGSNNSAFQIGSATGVSWDHCLAVADQALIKGRYPAPAGADSDMSGTKAVNGTGDGKMTVTDSTFIGSWPGVKFGPVENSITSNTGAGSPWSVQSFTQAWLDANAPYPTDAYLRSIWT